jgi:hypothetical protein
MIGGCFRVKEAGEIEVVEVKTAVPYLQIAVKPMPFWYRLFYFPTDHRTYLCHFRLQFDKIQGWPKYRRKTENGKRKSGGLSTAVDNVKPDVNVKKHALFTICVFHATIYGCIHKYLDIPPRLARISANKISINPLRFEPDQQL